MSIPRISSAELEDLAACFQTAGRTRFENSKFYRHFAGMIAHDLELLRLASTAKNPKLAAFLLFGAVYYLVLTGVSHPLVAYYRDATLASHLEEAYLCFRDFCTTHTAALHRIIAGRSVQTNEVGRAAFIRCGLSRIKAWLGKQRLSIIEVGASAGLLLSWDRYFMRFFRARESHHTGTPIVEIGDAHSQVHLSCTVRGEFFPTEMVKDGLFCPERFGLELHPLNLFSNADRLWLQALTWPDQPERAERLRAALTAIRSEPWPILRGDATRVLEQACALLRRENFLCLVHSFFLGQLCAREFERFQQQLHALAHKRNFAVLGFEWQNEACQLTLTKWLAGEARPTEVLALCDPHGGWMEWQAH